MSNESALSEFWNSTAPMSQVKEDSQPPNGTYDHTVLKLTPLFDDNGLAYISAELQSHAKDSPGTRPFTRTWRLYVGTHKDPEAKLPDTRLNAPGLRTLKGWCRVCDVPSNDQQIASMCAALLNKSFTNRIETAKSKKDGKEYTNLGRNPVKLGSIPARLDGVSDARPNGPLAQPSPAIAGATFGGE